MITGLTAQDKVYNGGTDVSTSGGVILGKVLGDDVGLNTSSASFTDKKAGSGKQVVLNSATLFTGTDRNNYTLIAQPGLTANIDRKPVSITVTVQSKTYNANTVAQVGTAVIDTLENGDVVGIQAGTATFEDQNVGTHYVNFYGWDLDGADEDAANYRLIGQPARKQASITKKPVSIINVQVASTKVYDGNQNVVITNTGIVNGTAGGESVALTAGIALYDNKNVGDNKTVSFSGFALTGTAAGNYTLSEQPENQSASISKRSATINGVNVADRPYNGNTTATITGTPVVSDLVSGDTITVTGGSAAFDDKNVGFRTVTFSGYGLSGADAGNYDLSQPASVMRNISQRSVTITVAVGNKTYDGNTTATVSGTPSISENFDGANLTVATGSANFANASVGTKSVSFLNWGLSGTAAGNYTLSGQPASVSANINQKPLTLTVTSNRSTLTPLSTETIATLTVTTTGLVGDGATATVSMTGVTGLTFAVAASTLTYNGTQAFGTPSQTLSFSVSASSSNYSNGSTSLTVTVYDGQDAGTSPDRRIPINSGNITAFNDYANTANGLTRHYKLTENVTFPSTWTLIGSGSGVDSFTGSFDGQKNTISSTRGIFGMTSGSSSTIKNIGLLGGSNNGLSVGVGYYVGGIVAYGIGGRIQNCYVTGTVNGGGNNTFTNSYVGGIAGSFSGTIENCYVTGNVSSGPAATNAYVGGIVGSLIPTSATVRNCYTTGSVTTTTTNASTTYMLGGIVGFVNIMTTVENCYATGTVYAGQTVNPLTTAGTYVGGIAGRVGSPQSTYGTVRNCIARNTAIRSSMSSVGRIVDDNANASLSDNYGSGMTMQTNYKTVPSTTFTTYTPTAASSGRDGGNVGNAPYYTMFTSACNFDLTNIWEWTGGNSDGRPILRNMPNGNTQ